MRTKALIVVLLAVLPATSFAADDTLVEKSVVRNRLFTAAGRFELGLNVGFSVLAALTDHYTFEAQLSYNVADWLAIEMILGPSISYHTSLADDVQTKFDANHGVTTADDLQNLWEMTGNALVGIRFQPIYGKIGLLAEYPLHFQFYISAGAGAALLKRTSVVICNHRSGGATSACDDFYTESKVSFLADAALGMRFFIPVIGNHHSLRVEFRGFIWPDSYFINVNRANAVANATTDPTGGGTLVQSGVTFLPQIHIGYAVMF